MFFHKYGEANVAVTNCMSHFSMFVPTKATVKLANGNTVNAQVIRIFLCRFLNCSILCPVRTVYYCLSNPSKTSHQVSSNFMLVFKMLHLNLFDIVILLILKFVLSLVWWYPRTTLRISKITMSKSFRSNIFKTNIKFEDTWWYSVGRVTWKIINWYN